MSEIFRAWRRLWRLATCPHRNAMSWGVGLRDCIMDTRTADASGKSCRARCPTHSAKRFQLVEEVFQL